jgi:ABC-type uncharacterized transport system permease subunit
MKTAARPLLVESAVEPKISLNPTASGFLAFGVFAMVFAPFFAAPAVWLGDYL